MCLQIKYFDMSVQRPPCCNCNPLPTSWSSWSEGVYSWWGDPLRFCKKKNQALKWSKLNQIAVSRKSKICLHFSIRSRNHNLDYLKQIEFTLYCQQEGEIKEATWNHKIGRCRFKHPFWKCMWFLFLKDFPEWPRKTWKSKPSVNFKHHKIVKWCFEHLYEMHAGRLCISFLFLNTANSVNF